MAVERKYLYGPVLSRRLGRSLGVDIVPFKVCTLDCVYCQLGKTTEKRIERKEYAPIEAVLVELKEILRYTQNDKKSIADFITISGSGEPTLHCRLGELIDGIKEISDIPVAVLTNGTLLYRQDVRAECAKADVVLPSLDAGDQQSFEAINRPHRDISIEKLISGLCAFRKEFSGQIWLEVFIVEGVNTGAEQIGKIGTAIERICPDKVQLNTAVRPTAEMGVKKLDERQLQNIAKRLGEKCEVVADYTRGRCEEHINEMEGGAESSVVSDKMNALLSMLKRRPCSLNEICRGMNIGHNEALKYIGYLQRQGVVNTEEKGGIIFFKGR